MEAVEVVEEADQDFDIDEMDDLVEDLVEESGENNNEDSENKDSWYISKLVNGKKENIHIRQALKKLVPRERISRDRSKRHIASNFLPDEKR